MKRTEQVAETRLYTTRHLYESHMRRLRELAVTKDVTVEDVVNEALTYGLDELERMTYDHNS
jgi:hypothetical protein